MNPAMRLLTGGFFTCTPAWAVRSEEPGHVHRFYFPRRGRGWYLCGRTRVDLRPGRVYLLPGGRPMACGCPGRLVLDWLHFRPEDLHAQALLCALPGPVVWPARQWAFWRPTYRRLDELFRDRPPSLQAQVQAMLLYFTAQVVGDAELSPHTLQQRREIERLRPAVEFMDRHHLSAPPLEEIARRVHLSRIYFHQRFVRLFGITPHAYMVRQRMERAVQLLAVQGLSVKQTAEQTGYPNAFYFSRAFKRHFGCSPRDAARRGLSAGP